MPVNWEQLHSSVQELRFGLGARAATLKAARSRALESLIKHVGDPGIEAKLNAVISTVDPDLRCAAPVSEPLNAAYAAPSASGLVTLIAADGSQVAPDRHDQVQFGVINVGMVMLRTNSGTAPTIDAESELLFGEHLYGRSGAMLSEGDIALARDRAERTSLLRLVREAGPDSIALTDGPLELWGAKEATDPGTFEDALRDYLLVLKELQELGCLLAGYVDKPAADLVVRLIEVLDASPTDLSGLRRFHPLREVSDRWLFGQILQPGERSAVFRLQSSSTRRYSGSLSIHFFYLNVGVSHYPALARVEIPQWVAADPESVRRVQSALLEQCLVLGARPYPYILHRAHETARVTVQEREEIGLRLVQELLDAGIEIEDRSGKSTAKQRSGHQGRF